MIQVACALIKNAKAEYLLVQRSPEMSHPLKWEFPGGKIRPHETAAQAVQREIREELALEVVPGEMLRPVSHEYPQKKICLTPIICELRSGDLRLYEHCAHAWLSLEGMQACDLLEADQLIVNQLT